MPGSAHQLAEQMALRRSGSLARAGPQNSDPDTSRTHMAQAKDLTPPSSFPHPSLWPMVLPGQGGSSLLLPCSRALVHLSCAPSPIRTPPSSLQPRLPHVTPASREPARASGRKRLGVLGSQDGRQEACGGWGGGSRSNWNQSSLGAGGGTGRGGQDPTPLGGGAAACQLPPPVPSGMEGRQPASSPPDAQPLDRPQSQPGSPALRPQPLPSHSHQGREPPPWHAAPGSVRDRPVWSWRPSSDTLTTGAAWGPEGDGWCGVDHGGS